jgi:hypothetical protein
MYFSFLLIFNTILVTIGAVLALKYILHPPRADAEKRKQIRREQVESSSSL